MTHTRKMDDETTHLLGKRGETIQQADGKSMELECAAGSFSSLALALRDKHEREEKESQGWWKLPFTTKKEDVEKRESVPVKPSSSVLGNVFRSIKTPQSRIEELRICLNKYESTQPQIYLAGLSFIKEADALLETNLSDEDTVKLNQSIECASKLVKKPSLVTVNAARVQAKITLGKEDSQWKKIGNALMMLGILVAVVCLAVAPPYALIAVGLFAASYCASRHGQQKSISKELDTLTTEVAKCST